MKFKTKINHLILFVCASLLLASCSSDDTPDAGNQAEIAEATPIDSKIVLDNLVINGGTKKAGAPQTPNEAISFTLNTANTTAVMIDGFDIGFKSDDNISGAYLQIKEKNGVVVDGYYDIDLSQITKNVTSSKSKRTLLKSRKGLNKKISIVDDIIVDVDFTNTIEPGTFCYIICVYDAEGNISAPQEVCVTVESWGGNDNLVGLWDYTKSDEFSNGETVTVNIGQEECYDGTVYCNNQDEIQYTECYTTDSFKFTINSNGTYEFEIFGTGEDIDYDASRVNCQIVEEINEDYYFSKGNWAYDQAQGNLVLVEFEYIENYGDDNYAETYGVGEAYVSELKAEVTGNSLKLTDEYFNTSGALEESYKYYFDKQ